MVVERKLSYSKSREKGYSRFRAFRGVWIEAKPGSSNGVVTVLDEDTVQVRENFWPGSHTSWPIDSIDVYRGAAINELPELRWKGDPQHVEVSIKRDSEVYIPDNFDEELARRDRAYLRRQHLDRF